MLKVTVCFKNLIGKSILLSLCIVLVSIVSTAVSAKQAAEITKKVLEQPPHVQTKALSETPSHATITPRMLSQILRQIDAYYVDEVNVNLLLENAVKEIFKQLDPHSSYLNEHELDALFEMANGQYDGLGIEVEIRNGVLVILDTLKNSPAEMAGLHQGDVIKTINGIAVKNLTLERVGQIIKGSEQKTILTVMRDFYLKPIEFIVEKAKIDINSVSEKMLQAHIGYLKIYSFQSNTTLDISTAISHLKNISDDDLRGLIIDLRDNPGGVLDSAVGVSDLFLDSGTIVTTRGRYSDANHNFIATPGDMMANKPIYVLINSGSASASEIVAGALKENKRATIVGMQSFGKGSVQSLIPLGNGSTAIKLTTALYFTPDGLSINGIGITPDVEIPQEQVDQNAQNPIMGLDDNWGLSGKVLANRDFQLDETQKLVLKHILH